MNVHEKKFVETVFEFYRTEGRDNLPWRHTMDPYHILVSEIMLQQTQVDRVIPKFLAFIHAFPTLASLASASLRDVLLHWQGLGYNRRAKMLHACAITLQADFLGKVPDKEKDLLSLPGIGPYTARAVLAFAFNVPLPLIETNVRTVYIHHFFADATDVDDADLLPYIERTLCTENPREWYYALMDYGSYLKRTVGNNISQSKHYNRQSTFKGSDRQIRGAIIRLLAEKPSRRRDIARVLTSEDIRIDAQLSRLKSEGLIDYRGGYYLLPS